MVNAARPCADIVAMPATRSTTSPRPRVDFVMRRRDTPPARRCTGSDSRHLHPFAQPVVWVRVSSEDPNPTPETAPRDPEELEARAAGPAPEISPLTTLGAVHLTVSDLERSVGYYETAIGLVPLDRGDGRATLGVAARPLLVLVEERGARPAAGYTGLYHFALLLPLRADLARWLAHAARDRVPLTGLSDHFVSEAIYLTDPDGHGIEIYQDRPRQTWEEFLHRAQSSPHAGGQSLPDYLKYGKRLGYWLEFLFQAFEGYTGNMILVRGVPDDPASLPHSDPKHRL